MRVDAGEVLTRKAPLPDAVVRYAARADALVDLHLPSGRGPFPLVVLLHGGFWKHAYDRVHVRPMARALVDAGCLVAVPEYRRVGGGGGWPTTAEDVRAAVTALPGLLEDLGLDTTTTTLAGHSAGGQLALWLGLDGPDRDPRRRALLPTRQDRGFDRVVALAPVADLRAAAAAGLGGDAVKALLGGGPDDVPDRYDAADPATLLAARPDRAAGLVLVHGSDDEDVPVGQSRSLAARHPAVRLRELPGVEHYGPIDPLSAAWPPVLAELTGGGRDG